MKPSKKAKKKLDERIKEYEGAVGRAKYPRGWRKPGSLNLRRG